MLKPEQITEALNELHSTEKKLAESKFKNGLMKLNEADMFEDIDPVDSLKAMRAQIRQMQARIDALEAELERTKYNRNTSNYTYYDNLNSGCNHSWVRSSGC